MPKMRAVQVTRPNEPLELVEREIPEPAAGTVRIKVQACGVCHSDSIAKEGVFPWIQYPRVPGHEVVGVVDAIGPGVSAWSARPARRSRLARRPLRLLRLLPPRRFLRLPNSHPHYRHHLRRRLRRLHDRAAPKRSPAFPRTCPGRSRPADVRRHHHVQLPPQRRRAARRPRGRTRTRRSRPSRSSVRSQDGLPHCRHRARPGQGTAGPPTRRMALHRQPVRRTPLLSSRD